MRIFALIVVFVVVATAVAQKRVLFIGDSITDGNWGNSKYWNQPCSDRDLNDMNHIFGHGYMYLCASKLMAEHPGQYQCLNRGISGNTVQDLAARWQVDAVDVNADVVSILIGINDVINAGVQNVDVQKFEDTYQSLIDRLKAKNANVKIVLGEPFCTLGSRVDTIGVNARNCKTLALAVKRLAEKNGASFVPYAQMFEKLCADGSNNYWIWDGVHPTPAGHYKMFQLIYDYIK
ncbi:MAG: SGNH/GDSL hydrolase family protein [Bacteroidales bacterium]|nr:SGNH/GDSL hydrolase family protein [Bacteroidales bacterium]